jgi:hypothetical protein
MIQETLLSLLRLAEQEKIPLFISIKDTGWSSIRNGLDHYGEIYQIWSRYMQVFRQHDIPSGHCYVNRRMTEMMTYEDAIRLLEMKAFW